MNKEQLVNTIAENLKVTKKDTEAILNEFINAVTDTLTSGDEVNIHGFGKFEVRNRAEKQGRNPQTGETITIPATRVPAFKAGKKLKEAVQG